MKPIEVFGKYAMAFEEVVRLDEWMKRHGDRLKPV